MTEDIRTPATSESAAPAEEPPLKPLDLRVARVMEAREHSNADRLLVLLLEVGGEERQVVAGIAGKYELTELEGKHVVIVANLKPAKLRGEVSQGMVLASENEEGRLGLVLAPDAEPGTRVVTAGMDGAAEAGQIDIGEFGRHTLRAEADKVTIDGDPVAEPALRVDRGVVGRVR